VPPLDTKRGLTEPGLINCPGQLALVPALGGASHSDVPLKA